MYTKNMDEILKPNKLKLIISMICFIAVFWLMTPKPTEPAVYRHGPRHNDSLGLCFNGKVFYKPISIPFSNETVCNYKEALPWIFGIINKISLSLFPSLVIYFILGLIQRKKTV